MNRTASSLVDIFDTEAVPEIGHLYDQERIISNAARYAARLDSRGLSAGGLVLHFEENDLFSMLFSDNPPLQGYAEWRLYRAVDIAKVLKTDKIVLFFPNETFPVDRDQASIRLCHILNCLFDYNKSLTLLLAARTTLHASGFPDDILMTLAKQFGGRRLLIEEYYNINPYGSD